MESPKTMAEGQHGVGFRETRIQILVLGTVVYGNCIWERGVTHVQKVIKHRGTA